MNFKSGHHTSASDYFPASVLSAIIVNGKKYRLQILFNRDCANLGVRRSRVMSGGGRLQPMAGNIQS